MTPKLGLGTAQIGLHYGIANNSGVPPVAEVNKMLSYAAHNEFAYIDTAAVYGTSETILGETIPLSSDFKIITKIHSFPKELRTESEINSWVDQQVESSLSKLHKRSIYGILLHTMSDLKEAHGKVLFQALQNQKSKGRCEKIGVSAYYSDDLLDIAQQYSFDLIQLPCNLCDQRCITSGIFRALKKFGVEIHVRSLFLQGLLLLDPHQLHDYFKPIADTLLEYSHTCDRLQTTPLHVAIQFGKQMKDVDALIVGAETCQQIDEIVSAYKDTIENFPYNAFMITEEKFLNPALWPSIGAR